MLDQRIVLDGLINADFNLGLAAERLKIKPAELLTYLTPDTEDTIIQHMRTRMTLELYRMWSAMTPFYVNALSESEPKEILKAHGNLTNSMALIIKQNPQANSNPAQIGQVVLNMLPPEIRDTVLGIIENNKQLEAPIDINTRREATN